MYDFSSIKLLYSILMFCSFNKVKIAINYNFCFTNFCFTKTFFELDLYAEMLMIISPKYQFIDLYLKT